MNYSVTTNQQAPTGVNQNSTAADDFKQAGDLFRSLPQQEKDRLISNLINELKQTNQDLQLRAICNYFRADVEFGMRIAQGLGVDISEYIPKP